MTRSATHRLNQECDCVIVDRPGVISTLQSSWEEADVIADAIGARANLFASVPVFLSRSDAAAMADIVNAIEAAVRQPGFTEAVLARAPDIARRSHGPAGVLMGYDFHLTGDGPKLIEINTNAGGAFLNALLARAFLPCCGQRGEADFTGAIVRMFESEWLRQRGAGRARRIAIVDDAPSEQYLYPEFLLAQQILSGAGFDVIVADASDLLFDGGRLLCQGRAIDLVYNRLVDFDLSERSHAALREAYDAGAVVVTPNPHNHALYADKRNLALLSNTAFVDRLGLKPADAALLRRLPASIELSESNANALCDARKNYFFKPAAGHGSKAVYRGDKLTRRTWEWLRNQTYIAQEYVPPSERLVADGAGRRACKVDVRLYVYAGQALLTAARVYQGQTTNFRTPGGGFAPVLLV